MNYYKLLELDEKATTSDIKKAFRRLSMKYHPDKPNGNEERFKEINQAYSILSDETQRIKYDRENIKYFDNISFDNNLINNLFNKINNNNNLDFFTKNMKNFKKPIPIIKTIEITFNQSFGGHSYPLEIERWIHDNGEKYRENEKVYIDIPKGIDENELIILRSKGNIIINETEEIKGDLKCFIKIINDTPFIRNGLNIIYHKHITLKEALCGFSFELNYIEQNKFIINNNNMKIISPGFQRTIPNKGFERNGKTGNLILIFNIIFPTELSEEQITNLNKIL
uniref:J domain-containing protein n=1 Tax=viral metagenome TaxID=1070528 RepID=A0A6C0KG85_9ZZZZ